MNLITFYSDLLGSDCIALTFRCQENFSQEPTYCLEITSPDPELNLERLLGSRLLVGIDLGDDMLRIFNTYVFGASDSGQRNEEYVYVFELTSWLSFLDQNRNCRIFQNLTIPEIVRQIFEAQQTTDFYFDLSFDYEPREYCVQFRESDLNFVKRLLEDEGIYFWVIHTPENHIVYLSDRQSFDNLPGPYDRLRFLPDGEESRSILGREGIQRLQRNRRVGPSRVSLRDFDYLAPSRRLDSDARLPEGHIEYYDYGVGYRDQASGERLALVMLEAFQADSHVFFGEANVRALTTGCAFTLVGCPAEERNRRYVVIGTDLTFISERPDSASQGCNVTVSFRALADNRPYRPLLVTPRPTVPGIQSATVVGPKGYEVHTDSLGRIRVHFHWDRYTTVEADASCWIRVSQAWAGKGWGVVAVPRVGQEVLVTYVDGDLDRPLVTGAVYNGENPIPYDLPKDIRYTGLVSRSLKYGNCQQASQITFDDQRGGERLILHAERDMQCTSERNSSVMVGQDQNVAVERISTSVIGTSISYVDTSIGFGRLSANFTDISANYVGLSSSCVGTSTSFTGLSADFTGMSSSFVGVANSFTGMSTNFTGASNSFTGVATSLTGADSSVTGTSQSIIGTSSSMIGASTSITGQSSSVTGQSMDVTGTSISCTGIFASVSGVSASMTGTSTSITGTSFSQTGESTSTTGISIAKTGFSTNVTGTDMSSIGSSTTVTGSSSSFTGFNCAITDVYMGYTQTDCSQILSNILNVGIQIIS
ncbi:type VI secretion system Vgr family protein [Paraburkholderia susongensis]|uniref:type VI secretion system Vgr family protein n=1 Tax=Paraburkholderia susongensis TaxID=1515439 RepID=UPI000A1CCB14|nr:type VI secretion system tip protein TssI/VgrG [Paraburkholderia susongensis]